MSTKLSFRARALDPSKAMPIYFAEELPDLQEYSAINRAVPQMPSGMEKEEESEHHLQRAIIAGLIIPTPEVSDVKDDGFYDKNYPADYKMPRQLIHVQPLSLEQDIPDYDMDSADETWFDSQTTKSELTPFKFEQMMDRLEKITVCSLDDAKALVRRNEVNQDVFDYWVNKRLKTKHPLILAVKTENRGNTTSNNPYIAFRRRTEKMQTRKNRKNDETSYEKMLKLRRDLSRAVKLLEMVKRREKTKREELQLSIEIYEKRYQAKDFSGQLFAEYTSAATKLRPAFAPLYSNQYHHQHSSNMSSSQHNQWNSSSQNYANLHINHLQNNKREFDGLSTSSSRKEKRQYKKRKHKAPREIKPIEPYDGLFTSDDDDIHNNQIIASESEDEGIYPFRRNRNCDYFKPHGESFGNWPWESTEENGIADPRYRYSLTSLRLPRPRCIGFARRRVGRGGRILLDRASSSYDDVWSRLDYKIFDTKIDACEDRVPEIIESKMIDSNSEKDVDDVSEKVWSQNTTVQNNHHFNNIVIKSENSKTHELSDDQKDKVSPGVERSNVVNNQKLDDFEQLLDSASASSNIINKKLVCKNNSDISDESFVLKSTGSNSTSQSELLNKNLSVGILNSLNCEASSSGVSSTNGSLSFNLNNLRSQSSTIELSSLELDKQANDDESGSEMKPETSCSEHPEDFFEDLIDEIKNEWLHFRPRTPTSPQPYDVMFDSDFIDKTKKFAVELQIMDDDFKETDLSSYVDNVYSSQPMSFDVSDRNILMNDNMENTMNVIKTEPSDKDYDFIDEIGSTTQEPTPKTIEQDAVKKLLQKYQNDVDNEESLEIDVDGLDFEDCLASLEPIGCSSFKLHNEDLLKTFKTESSNSGKAEHNLDVSIKSEALEFPINPLTSSVQQMSNTAPIAELQSHNYVLQYGSPVTSNTVTLSTLTGNSSMMCGPNVVTSAVPATTLFQQPFVNSGSTIITTPQQSHQSKLQPIVYDNNTFVLTPTRKQQLNGPSDRNSNQNKYKQVFMLDLTQGQDKRKSIGDNSAIKKTYADLTLSNQNILVSSVNSNILSTNPNNLQQQTQTQQYSLVHQNALQKPIILSTSTSGGPGTLIQSSQTSNAGNKIIVTPASQIAGNVYVSTHGKLVIPSSNNSQSIILDSSKMMSTNNQLQSQPKLQSHQQRVKMENKMNMLLENSGEKNIIYAKYNKSKLLQTVANIIPMQSTANKSGMQAQNQIVKQIQPITSSPQQQSIGIISNTKTLQRIHQQPILRTQFGSTSVNFQNSPTSSKMIQQPNNGNSVLGSVNNNNDNSSQVNSTTTPTIN